MRNWMGAFDTLYGVAGDIRKHSAAGASVLMAPSESR
jgi:hypothetical protein